MTQFMTQQHIIINDPIYDRECMYYHTNSGCKYGHFCHYKHLERSSPSPYQILLQYHQMNNQLLHQILFCLQEMVSNNTTKIPPTAIKFDPMPVHELKSDTPSPAPLPPQAKIHSIQPIELVPTTPNQNNSPTPDLDLDLPPKPHPVKQAVLIYQNLQRPQMSQLSQASPCGSLYHRLKQIWPNMEHFEQVQQPIIEYFDHAHQVELMRQVDLEYRELFDKKS